MKKQILAVAVAGAFAVPALAAADTNVTLFGQLQTQIVHHSASGDGGALDSGFRQHDAGAAGGPGDGSGPNAIGVMINHDLGNGMTALAKFEQDFATTSGFNSGARDVYVGLDGNFGRVIAGRMTSSYSTAGKDPLNATFMQGRTNGARIGPEGGFGNGSYVDRGVRYSNSFGIVSLDVGMFIDNGNDSDTAWSGRLNFDVGGVDLYVAYVDFSNHNENGLDGENFVPPDQRLDTARHAKIGADWSTGPFRLVGEIEQYKYGNDDLDEDIKGNTFFLSGTYTMGRNDFVLNLGHHRPDRINGERYSTDYVALAVKHNFSNRVMAYAGVGYNSTDDIGVNGRDLSFTGVGGGMRVSF